MDSVQILPTGIRPIAFTKHLKDDLSSMAAEGPRGVEHAIRVILSQQSSRDLDTQKAMDHVCAIGVHGPPGSEQREVAFALLELLIPKVRASAVRLVPALLGAKCAPFARRLIGLASIRNDGENVRAVGSYFSRFGDVSNGDEMSVLETCFQADKDACVAGYVESPSAEVVCRSLLEYRGRMGVMVSQLVSAAVEAKKEVAERMLEAIVEGSSEMIGRVFVSGEAPTEVLRALVKSDAEEEKKNAAFRNVVGLLSAASITDEEAFRRLIDDDVAVKMLNGCVGREEAVVECLRVHWNPRDAGRVAMMVARQARPAVFWTKNGAWTRSGTYVVELGGDAVKGVIGNRVAGEWRGPVPIVTRDGELTEAGQTIASPGPGWSVDTLRRPEVSNACFLRDDGASGIQLSEFGRVVESEIGLDAIASMVTLAQVVTPRGDLSEIGRRMVSVRSWEDFDVSSFPHDRFVNGDESDGRLTAVGREIVDKNVRGIASLVCSVPASRLVTRDGKLTEVGIVFVDQVTKDAISSSTVAEKASQIDDTFLVRENGELTDAGSKLLTPNTVREIASKKLVSNMSSRLGKYLLSTPFAMDLAFDAATESDLYDRATGMLTPLGEQTLQNGDIDKLVAKIPDPPPLLLSNVPSLLPKYADRAFELSQTYLLNRTEENSAATDACLASLSRTDPRVIRLVADKRGLPGIASLGFAGHRVSPSQAINRLGSWAIFAALSMASVASDIWFMVDLFAEWHNPGDVSLPSKVAKSLALTSAASLFLTFIGNLLITRWFVLRAHDECKHLGCSFFSEKLLWGENMLVSGVILTSCVATPEAGTLLYGSLSPPQATARLKQWSWPAVLLEDLIHFGIQIVAFLYGYSSSSSIYASLLTTLTQLAFRAGRSLILTFIRPPSSDESAGARASLLHAKQDSDADFTGAAAISVDAREIAQARYQDGGDNVKTSELLELVIQAIFGIVIQTGLLVVFLSRTSLVLFAHYPPSTFTDMALGVFIVILINRVLATIKHVQSISSKVLYIDVMLRPEIYGIIVAGSILGDGSTLTLHTLTRASRQNVRAVGLHVMSFAPSLFLTLCMFLVALIYLACAPFEWATGTDHPDFSTMAMGSVGVVVCGVLLLRCLLYEFLLVDEEVKNSITYIIGTIASAIASTSSATMVFFAIGISHLVGTKAPSQTSSSYSFAWSASGQDDADDHPFNDDIPSNNNDESSNDDGSEYYLNWRTSFRSWYTLALVGVSLYFGFAIIFALSNGSKFCCASKYISYVAVLSDMALLGTVIAINVDSSIYSDKHKVPNAFWILSLMCGIGTGIRLFMASVIRRCVTISQPMNLERFPLIFSYLFLSWGRR